MEGELSVVKKQWKGNYSGWENDGRGIVLVGKKTGEELSG